MSMMSFTVQVRCPECGKEYKSRRLQPSSRVISKKCAKCAKKTKVEKSIQVGGTDEKSCRNCKYFSKHSEKGNKYWRPCLLGVAGTMDNPDGSQVVDPDLVYIEDVCGRWSKE